MKGEKAEYYISFEKAFMFPRPKRVRKALGEIRKFAAKHTRASVISISSEVNELVHRNSKNIPRGIKAVLYREDGKVSVFLREGTGMEAYIRKRAEEKKKTEAEKKKEGKAEKKPGKEGGSGKVAKEGTAGKAGEDTSAQAREEGEAEAERKRLLEEKRLKEEAGKAIEMKRG